MAGHITSKVPFRIYYSGSSPKAAITAARARGCLAVEMETAALYAYARAAGRPAVCFAHVTNAMGQDEGDFEKGEIDGAAAALLAVGAAARAFVADGQDWTCRRGGHR